MGYLRTILFLSLISLCAIAHADGDPLCRAYVTLPDNFSHPKAIEYIKTGKVEPGFEAKGSREFYAAILGRTDDLAKLLANRDKRKPFEANILRTTVQSGEAQSVKLLLEAGAPPDLGGEGGTPLLAAIHCNEPTIASYLLAAGADVYWHSKTYGDAMISAVVLDSIEITRLLLVAGYDPACATYLGPQRPIERLANHKGDADMVLLLASFRDIRAASKKPCVLPPQDRTPLPEPDFKSGSVGGLDKYPE